MSYFRDTFFFDLAYKEYLQRRRCCCRRATICRANCCSITLTGCWSLLYERIISASFCCCRGIRRSKFGHSGVPLIPAIRKRVWLRVKSVNRFIVPLLYLVPPTIPSPVNQASFDFSANTFPKNKKSPPTIEADRLSLI